MVWGWLLAVGTLTTQHEGQQHSGDDVAANTHQKFPGKKCRGFHLAQPGVLVFEGDFDLAVLDGSDGLVDHVEYLRFAMKGGMVFDQDRSGDDIGFGMIDAFGFRMMQQGLLQHFRIGLLVTQHRHIEPEAVGNLVMHHADDVLHDVCFRIQRASGLFLDIPVHVPQHFQGAPQQGNGRLHDVSAPQLFDSQGEKEQEKNGVGVQVTTTAGTDHVIDLSQLVGKYLTHGFQGRRVVFELEDPMLSGLASHLREVAIRREANECARGPAIDLNLRHARAIAQPGFKLGEKQSVPTLAWQFDARPTGHGMYDVGLEHLTQPDSR